MSAASSDRGYYLAGVTAHLRNGDRSFTSDNSSITITRDFAVQPPTNPETAITTNQSLQILADSTNGTIFYDVDAKTRNVVKDFSSVASTLTNKYVRVAARYQQDGTLVAVRVWASTSFNSVWLSPEGHVLHVDTTADVITTERKMVPRRKSRSMPIRSSSIGRQRMRLPMQLPLALASRS